MIYLKDLKKKETMMTCNFDQMKFIFTLKNKAQMKGIKLINKILSIK